MLTPAQIGELTFWIHQTVKNFPNPTPNHACDRELVRGQRAELLAKYINNSLLLGEVKWTVEEEYLKRTLVDYFHYNS